jgi:PAS domain S-box-containing protein
LLAIGLDITERKKAEEELQKAKDELEERVKERTTELESTVELLKDEINERKNIETVLKENEDRLHKLSEAAFEGIAISESGKVIECNQQFADIFGYEMSEAIGITVSDLVVPEYVELVHKNIREGYKEAYEFLALRKDGSIIQIEVRGRPIIYKGQEVRETVIRDITERKKTEEVVKNNQYRLEMALEAGGAGIYDHRVPIGPELYHSEQWANILGYTTNDIPPYDKFIPWLMDHVHPDDQQKLDKVYSDFIEGRTSKYDIEIRMKHASGKWIYVQGLSKAIDRDEKGKISRVVGVMLDITERKRAEKELQKAKEEIEGWNRELEIRVKEKTEDLVKSQAQLIQSEKLSAMGQMAGGLAHELNSPLGGLLPMLEKYKNEAEKDSKEYNELSLMHKACEHMAKIVRDFGSFSRESKGEYYELNLNEVIDDTLGFIASRIKQKGIQLIREYKDTLPKVNGEKTELQQVILNMITNAIDAMTDDGEFTIRTDISKDRNKVIMEFIDNGAGIEKEYLGKIFDPFQTTKRPGKGTGLGLSVSYKIIEKHGGNISVESEPGKGTKFTIYLPAVKSNNT